MRKIRPINPKLEQQMRELTAEPFEVTGGSDAPRQRFRDSVGALHEAMVAYAQGNVPEDQQLRLLNNCVRSVTQSARAVESAEIMNWTEDLVANIQMTMREHCGELDDACRELIWDDLGEVDESILREADRLARRRGKREPSTDNSSYTPKQVAQRLNMPYDKVLGLIRSGRLRASNVGRVRSRYLVTDDAIEEYLESAEVQSGARPSKPPQDDDPDVEIFY
jgi:excisionase family DNA binding protein